MTTNQYHLIMDRRRSHPLYANPCVLEDAYYIDLQSAYWSIMSIVGWDVDYCPGKWIGVSSNVEDFPFKSDKLARNSMVSVGLPGLLRVWTGTRLSFVKRANPFVNLGLWSLIHDVLHGVASEMVEIGAKYVHTDGYILPSGNASDAFDILDSWGLSGSVKERGSAIIRGAGDYDIGGHTSKVRRHGKPKDVCSLYPVSRSWLKARISSLSHKRQSRLAREYDAEQSQQVE
jgi:hypothetical protein